MAEWSCRGLQIPVRRFDSGSRLQYTYLAETIMPPPIKIPEGLPAAKTLKEEHIDVIGEASALKQDIRPLRIALLNLMPNKIDTETQILRAIANGPLQIEVTLLHPSTYTSKNADTQKHIKDFYKTFDTVKDQIFDGIIVTGTPVETIEFEEVEYWEEFKEILQWSNKNCFSRLFLCWGAQAALYEQYNVPKKRFSDQKKKMGVFEQSVAVQHRLLSGFDDRFYAPVGRYTEVAEETLPDNLTVLAKSKESGICLLVDDTNRDAYMFNHLEYERDTLKNEYERDISKGHDIPLPAHYFPDDDQNKSALVNWRAHRTLFFSNWINMIYRGTPYCIEDIREL